MSSSNHRAALFLFAFGWCMMWLAPALQAQLPQPEVPDEAALYAQAKALAQANELDQAAELFRLILQNSSDEERSNNCTYNLGVIALQQDRYWSAIRYFDQAKAYYEVHNEAEHAAGSDISLGRAYKELGLREQSLHHLLDGARAFQALGLQEKEAKAYNSIGNLLRRIGDFASSIEYHKKALSLFRSEDDDYHMAGVLNNLGKTHLEMEALDEAMTYFERALDVKAGLEGAADSLYVATTLTNMAEAHVAANEPGDALRLLDQALPIFRKSNNLSDYAFGANLYGAALTQLHRFDQAGTWLIRSDSIAAAIEAYDELLDNYRYQSGLYQAKAEYSKAIEFQEKRFALLQRINEQSRESSMAEMQTLFEVEDKERENAAQREALERQEVELEQLRVWVIVGVFMVLLLISIAILIYQRWRQDKKHRLEVERYNRELEAKNEQVQQYAQHNEQLFMELNHRVGNNLEALSGSLIMQRKEMVDKAAVEAMERVERQVEAMKILHSILRDNAGDAKGHVQFNVYLTKLEEHLSVLFTAQDVVHCPQPLDKISLPLKQATYLGLIANEAISNAFKYGEKAPGAIALYLREMGGEKPRTELIVKNRVASSTIDERKGGGMGSMLMQTLAKELDADMNVDQSDGWRFCVRF